MADLELRPAYWANISGGKDSLYMLMLILAHPELYPLVDFGIQEDTILEWAKTVPEFNGYYKTNRIINIVQTKWLPILEAKEREADNATD